MSPGIHPEDVVIVGIGQTPVQEHWDVSLRELGFMAIDLALKESNGLRPQVLFAGNMLAPQISRQAHLATLLADFSGLGGIEASSVEAAGASGGAALRLAYLAVASGQADIALAVGVEKFTDQVGPEIEAALASAVDSDYEAAHGQTTTAQAALLMRRYLHEYHAPRQAFAAFPLVAHANGAGNPHAMFQKAIRAETYQQAGVVSDPLNLFDVAPLADGAAAVILTRRALVPQAYPHPLVRIAGSALVTDSLALHDRPNPLDFSAARLSVERALSRARLSLLQVDFFELYDAYSIYALLSLEAAGFASPGDGWKIAQDGCLEPGGSLPISTLGGLKARGNPGGATGVYQAVEAVLQLRGAAGVNQLPEAHRALIQCLGGPAATAAAHVLERLD
jgi:acetyl-CoA C-acetyltransferase